MKQGLSHQWLNGPELSHFTSMRAQTADSANATRTSISLLAHVNKNVVVWEFSSFCGLQSIAYCWLSVTEDVKETWMTIIQVYWHTFWTHIWTGSVCPPVETQPSLHTCSTICFQVTTQRPLFVSTVASVILACCHIRIRIHQGITLKTTSQLNINRKCEVTSRINKDQYGWFTIFPSKTHLNRMLVVNCNTYM
jgi:hypothetical protein